MTTTTMIISYHLSQEVMLFGLAAICFACGTAYLIFGPKDPQ